MKKLAVGFSILSTLALATGCTDEPSKADDAQTGKAAFALTDGDYTLGITLEIFASDDIGQTTVIETATALVGDATLEVPLPVGEYTVEATAWTLTGPGIDGSATEADADDNVALTSFDPDPFTVTAGGDVAVDINFTVDFEAVTLTLVGNASFAPDVTATNDCDPACEAPQICAVVGGDAAACRTPCDPADLEDPCGAEECIPVAANDDGILGLCDLVP